MRPIFLGMFAASLLGMNPTLAVLSTYSDRSTWETAIGGAADYTVDFNSVTVDTSYNDPATFDAGPFTLSSIGADMRAGTPLNLIDVSEFLIPSTPPIDGTPDAVSRLNDDTTEVIIDFDRPISAFGGDFASISDNVPVVITLHRTSGGTDTVNVPNISTTAEFFGFASDPAVAYSKLSLGNSGVDEFWRMDNLSAVTAVPEPAALMLLGAVSSALLVKQRFGGE